MIPVFKYLEQTVLFLKLHYWNYTHKMAEAAFQEQEVTEDEEAHAERHHRNISEKLSDSKEKYGPEVGIFSSSKCSRNTTENTVRHRFTVGTQEVEENHAERKYYGVNPKGINIISKLENFRLRQNNPCTKEVANSQKEYQCQGASNMFAGSMSNSPTEENVAGIVDNQSIREMGNVTADDTVENNTYFHEIPEEENALVGEGITVEENTENTVDMVIYINQSQDNQDIQAVAEEDKSTGINAADETDTVENINDIPEDGDNQSEENAGTVREEEELQKSDTSDNIENKSEKDTWTPDDITALLIKAINFHASKQDLKTVIGCGADVNRPMRNGLCPLHYAAYSDYFECIELLLNSGANVNVTDDIGYTPLHLAARRGNTQSLEMLIENGAIINYTEPGAEIHQTDEKNKLGYTTMEPLNLAIQNGHSACAKILLEKGARPDNKYFMGYEICLAPLDEPDCLELLLQYGADPNVFNRCGLSPLMKACKDHHIEAVRRLIKYGADVNAICPPLFEQKSVLQFAINSGNIVIINILLGKKVTLSRQGEYKYSALHSAIQKGRAEVCRLLLQHGADVNERTDEGATPMMLACATPELKERREIVQLLLDCGADINAHAPCYSYFDPYLAPLTEYFKCIGSTEGFSIVRLMIRNGAKLNFCSSGLDMERQRLRDPFSIVPYVACMENNETIFDFVVTAAYKYSPLIIYATANIPEHMKDSLIYTATRPRELKHLARVSIRDLLTPGLLTKVEALPLPPILKQYLLFR